MTTDIDDHGHDDDHGQDDQDLGFLRLGSTPGADAELPQPGLPRRRRRGTRAVLFAGVAGACVLGVGLGLWARPSPHERGIVAAAPEPEAPPVDPAARHLTIVVGDGPAAQVGAPLETLRPPPRPLFATLRPKGGGAMGETPELTRLQPKPLPRFDLPKIETPHFQAPKLPDLAPLAVAALAAPVHWLQALKPHGAPVETARAQPVAAPLAHPAAVHHIQLATAERDARAAQAQAERDAERQAAASAQAEARRMQLAEAAEARAEAAHRQQARLEEARAEKAEQARQAKLLQQARLDQAKAAKAEKLRLAQEAQKAGKAQKAEALKLAQAEARGRAEARAEAKALVLAEARDEAKKRERLEALVKAVRKALPHMTGSVQTARLDGKAAARARHEEPTVQRASLKPRRGPHNVEPPGRSHPVQLAPADPSGLVKVSTPRCASRDPGAALVCADPALGAADRQMTRAYQGARAAGVPEGQLQAQQQRWLAARATAAREAPWALRDVYLARIAELNSQARDAHAGDDY